MNGPPDPAESRDTTRPPLGSWTRLYVLVAVLAVVVMLVLYFFTAHFNFRSGKA